MYRLDETLSSDTISGTEKSLEIPATNGTTMLFIDPLLLPYPVFLKALLLSERK